MIEVFAGIEIEYDPAAALRPYPETERLVEKAVEIIGSKPANVCDFGTGSGNIAIALLVRCPNATVVGIDISKAAIETAKANAARHGVGDRFKGRVADRVDGSFDLVVCNPNYWTDDAVDAVDHKKFGPRIAFTDGIDGRSMYRTLIAERHPLMLLEAPEGVENLFTEWVTERTGTVLQASLK